MIIDTSAIIAVLFDEDDAELYAEAIARAESRRVSAATFVEAAIVVEAQTKGIGGRQLDAFFRHADIAIRSGHRGTGAHGQSSLYRLRQGSAPGRTQLWGVFCLCTFEGNRRPLLFKGKDFAKTDLVAAI